MYSPAPAPTPLLNMTPAATPPLIALPSSSNFPTSNYTVGQYRIQAVDPMITLDSNGNALVESGSQKGSGTYGPLSPAATPPAAYGPNQAYGANGGFPYSYFYLAAADVSVPALTGNVTAKVRRVFERKFDLPWSYAMFYVDDLELQPASAFTLTGPIHTNGSLYIGTSSFTAASPIYAAPTPFPTSGRVEYGANYANGYSPNDPRYPGSGFTTPNFAKSNSSLPISDCPPAQVSPYLPFGWNLSLNGSNSGSGSANDDSYHEIIERPGTGTDTLANVRYYNQASYRIVIDANNVVTVTYKDGTTPSNSVKTVFTNAITTNQCILDAREGMSVLLQLI